MTHHLHALRSWYEKVPRVPHPRGAGGRARVTLLGLLSVGLWTLPQPVATAAPALSVKPSHPVKSPQMAVPSTAAKQSSSDVLCKVPSARLSQEAPRRNVQVQEKVVPATVPLLPPPDPSWLEDMRASTPSSTLSPGYSSFRAYPGQSLAQTSWLDMAADSAPARGDVLISFDLTGSMGGELSNVKNNSVNIMNQVRSLIPDTRFGVISYKDYPTVDPLTSCDYSDYYGKETDVAYARNAGLSDDSTAISSVISGLSLGHGMDAPENYGRAFMEAAHDAGIGWREGSRRILLNWGDNVPHDCAYDAIVGGATSTGVDPGRDGVVGTSDDVAILDALDALVEQDITLLHLHSGSSSRLTTWDAYAARTGGDAVKINSDGTIPGKVNIASYIASLIKIELSSVSHMSLEVCTPGYEDWLAGVSPEAYENLSMSTAHSLDFDLSLRVPSDATVGTHCFDVCAIGDGAEYASQRICVEVETCGDGQLQAGESCDDGNRVSGDGCSSQCEAEGYATPTPEPTPTATPEPTPTSTPEPTPTSTPEPTPTSTP
ncbi:MAG: DUF4215 domain-containing protein, partial [Myxococcota bacterium]